MAEKEASLIQVRCLCGRLLGMIRGSYEIKCNKCKRVNTGKA